MNVPLNNLYVALANALGLPWTTFGEPRFDYRYIGGPTELAVGHRVEDGGAIPGLVA